MNSLVVVLLRMVWWLCAYLLPIDASLAEGFTEEEYFEEEEENFDHYTNQGKPSCNLHCKLSHDTLILPMFYYACFAKLYFCLEKIIGLDASCVVLMFSRASSLA